MVDSIEKFLEVKINQDVVALGNIALRLSYRLMGRAPRSESIAVLGKRWIPLLLQNLQHGLLDQSVEEEELKWWVSRRLTGWAGRL